ncbi:hypothetical protein RhiirA1_480648 [Rhizophagus irregularis]|uniref:Uncharacterized protein n=1 Tax=Rhizophagus irregularis TaxID=588596 RepID=A0A2N0QP36_9GLOM|nr:hypothetical protein RhiirA1_480648 [Rhizophagus irregularis]
MAHYSGHNNRKVFRNFLERKNSFLLCNKEDNSREWEEKKLKLEAEENRESTQKSQNGKIDEIPAKITSDTYWKDEEIYSTLQKVGYIERLVAKRSYKYKTVRTNIHISKEMEAIFIKGGSNITIKKNDQQNKIYFDVFQQWSRFIKAIYQSTTMEDEMGKGLQIKGQMRL